jgi:hypothetical protein
VHPLPSTKKSAVGKGAGGPLQDERNAKRTIVKTENLTMTFRIGAFAKVEKKIQWSMTAL